MIRIEAGFNCAKLYDQLRSLMTAFALILGSVAPQP